MTQEKEKETCESAVEPCELVENLELVDVACEEVRSPPSHVYQIHITYSATYRVPVLYFNGRSTGTSLTMSIFSITLDTVLNTDFLVGTPFADGQLLQIDDIYADIPSEVKKSFSDSHISQGEHPVLGIPFYFVHPCNTAALMALLRVPPDSGPETDRRGFVVDWLSWVSPIFNIPLMIEPLAKV